MIVLDTNVLSALMRHPPDTGVVEWLDKQPRTSHSRESLLRRSRIESLLLIQPPRNRLGI